MQTAGIQATDRPRLLIAVHLIPYPRSRDGCVLIVNPLIEHLSKEYAIDAVFPVFSENEEDRRAIDALRPFCDRVVAFPFNRSMLWRGLIATFDPRTLIYYLYPRRVIRRRIVEALKDRIGKYHAILIQDMHLALFADLFDPSRTARRLLLPFDFETLRFERLAASPGMSPRNWYWRISRKRIARYEPKIYRMYDSVVFVSEEDQRLFARRHPELADKISVIPMSVEIERWQRAPNSVASEPDVILFTGNMIYGPNRQAVTWFRQHVWPRLVAIKPSVKWWIVGYRADEHFRDLGPGIEVHSSVPDVPPFVHRSTVVISPLQSGTGIKNKVIEAMAAGKAVVGTSLSFEGIPITDGEDAVVADDPQQMAQRIADLFDDEARREAIGSRASRLSASRYELSGVLDQWRKIIGSQ